MQGEDNDATLKHQMALQMKKLELVAQGERINT